MFSFRSHDLPPSLPRYNEPDNYQYQPNKENEDIKVTIVPHGTPSPKQLTPTSRAFDTAGDNEWHYSPVGQNMKNLGVQYDEYIDDYQTELTR